MCVHSIQYLTFVIQSVVCLKKEANNNSQTKLLLDFSFQYVFLWRESTSSTTLSLVFLSFTLSLPLSFIPLCSAQINSIHLNGFHWHEIWHVSSKHGPTEIDQSLNKSRCQPSFHLFLFTLAPFYWLFWSWHQRFSINSTLSVFSILFPSSLSLCLWSNCHGLGRIKEDEVGMGWVE